MLAGTGDDKTDIVVFAKYEDRADIYSVDRAISANGNEAKVGRRFLKTLVAATIPVSSTTGHLSRRAQSALFIPGSGTSIYGPNTPNPHSFVNLGHPRVAAGTQYHIAVPSMVIQSDRAFFNFARLTPAIPGGDKENLYASYTHDICDKYLTVFADFSFSRSFFNAALAPVPFVPDPFVTNSLGTPLSAVGVSVPTQNAFNPFTSGGLCSACWRWGLCRAASDHGCQIPRSWRCAAPLFQGHHQHLHGRFWLEGRDGLDGRLL